MFRSEVVIGVYPNRGWIVAGKKHGWTRWKLYRDAMRVGGEHGGRAHAGMGNPPAKFGFREIQPIERKRHFPDHGDEHTPGTSLDLSSAAINGGESSQKTQNEEDEIA